MPKVWITAEPDDRGGHVYGLSCDPVWKGTGVELSQEQIDRFNASQGDPVEETVMQIFLAACKMEAEHDGD